MPIQELPRHVHTGLDSQRSTFTDLAGVLDTRANYDPPNIIAGSAVTTDFTVKAARFGDFVLVSELYDLQGIQLTGYVSGAGTVTAVFYNGSANAVNLGTGTVTIRLIKA